MIKSRHRPARKSAPKGKRQAFPKAGHYPAPVGKVWDRLLQAGGSIGALYAMSPMLRVDMVKQGVPPEALSVLARDMGISKEHLYATLGVPRATMERKLRQRRLLSPDESERVVGIARLVGQVEQMVHDCGDFEDFDAARWVAAWLDRPLPALAGSRPGALMDTAEGREIVANLVAQMQSGAYA